MGQPLLKNTDAQAGILSLIGTHFWFKCIGTTSFIAVFFSAYIFLLKHPFGHVAIIPATAIDRFIGVEPWALPLYFSLWLYVSLPIMLMTSRQEVVRYGVWIGALCLTALSIFYFWPNAIPPANIDWARYPGLSFLKGIDAAGNACPSLHVATAIFSWAWLQRHPLIANNRRQIFNTFWCAAIVYSTMATKQHMAIDVAGGIGLAAVFILAMDKAGKARTWDLEWRYARNRAVGNEQE